MHAIHSAPMRWHRRNPSHSFKWQMELKMSRKSTSNEIHVQNFCLVLAFLPLSLSYSYFYYFALGYGTAHCFPRLDCKVFDFVLFARVLLLYVQNVAVPFGPFSFEQRRAWARAHLKKQNTKLIRQNAEKRKKTPHLMPVDICAPYLKYVCLYRNATNIMYKNTHIMCGDMCTLILQQTPAFRFLIPYIFARTVVCFFFIRRHRHSHHQRGWCSYVVSVFFSVCVYIQHFLNFRYSCFWVASDCFRHLFDICVSFFLYQVCCCIDLIM